MQANRFALFVKPIFCICVIGRVDVVRCERVLAADDPAVLDHALHADNARGDRGDPAIAVLSIGYRSLGSCSRAAGWSAATSCVGAKRSLAKARTSAECTKRRAPGGRSALT